MSERLAFRQAKSRAAAKSRKRVDEALKRAMVSDREDTELVMQALRFMKDFPSGELPFPSVPSDGGITAH
jgi:hypothetical protein